MGWDTFSHMIDFLVDVWDIPLTFGGITFTLWQVSVVAVGVTWLGAAISTGLDND